MPLQYTSLALTKQGYQIATNQLAQAARAGSIILLLCDHTLGDGRVWLSGRSAPEEVTDGCCTSALDCYTYEKPLK